MVICRSSPAQKAAVVRMMMEYEMQQAEGHSRGLLKWYRRQMKKQVETLSVQKDPQSYCLPLNCHSKGYHELSAPVEKGWSSARAYPVE